MTYRQDRLMIFIDGSNLYHSLKGIFKRTDIDIGKFCQKLLERRRLIRIYYYNAVVGRREEPERFRDQQAFFNSVAAIPYVELRLGRLVYMNWPNTPPYEKGVDIQLATDLLTHNFKNNYDVAVLVAGDTDYVGALQAVKDNGKNVEVVLFGKEQSSRPLREVTDKVIGVDGRFMRGCWKEGDVTSGQHRKRQYRERRSEQGGETGKAAYVEREAPLAEEPSQQVDNTVTPVYSESELLQLEQG